MSKRTAPPYIVVVHGIGEQAYSTTTLISLAYNKRGLDDSLRKLPHSVDATNCSEFFQLFYDMRSEVTSE